MKNNRFGQAKVLDTSELDLLLKYLVTREQKVLAQTLRNTGARVGEVVQLRWRDIGKEQILFPKSITKRKLKSRELFISESFHKYLMDWSSYWTIYKRPKTYTRRLCILWKKGRLSHNYKEFPTSTPEGFIKGQNYWS